MKKIVVALVCGLASTAMAQIGDYLGPGILSPGAGTIGTRSGQQVDLRFFATLQGVYDNGLIPFATNSQGQLLNVGGLYGEQLNVGAYGQHAWKQSLLGLDFSGNLYHYDNDSQYDGNAEFLNLGYTYQHSRRLIFDFHGVGGSTSIGYGTPGYYQLGSSSSVVGQQSSVLFDNRIYYLQGGASATYLLSARTSFVVGGDGYTARYQAASLIGLNGFNVRGSILHRLSRSKTLGFNYQRMHYQFVRSYGQSNVNIGQLIFADGLGPHWTFSVAGGIAQTWVQGVEQISVSPVLAALLGQSFGYQTFNATNYYPNGTVNLTGHNKNSGISFQYTRNIVPGNGVYLTSRQDAGGASYSFTGIRRWNLGVSGAYYRMSSIGQILQPYSTYGAGAGFAYSMGHSLQLVGRYDYRRQDISYVGFRQNASRVSAGIGWSPGELPLSLW